MWKISLTLLFFITKSYSQNINNTKIVTPISNEQSNQSFNDLTACPENYQCFPQQFCGEILNSENSRGQCSDPIDVCCFIKKQPEISTTKPEESTIKPCGIRNGDNNIKLRISSDPSIDSSYKEFPWMVLILIKNFTKKGLPINIYQSGGSLIHPSVVLTAAHRVSGYQTNILKVRAGEWDTETTNELYEHQDRDVAQVLLHNDFEINSLRNDIALVFVTSPFELNEAIQPICLPPLNSIFDDQRCFATGWGKNVYADFGRHSTILKKVNLPIVSLTKCEELLKNTRLSKHFILHDSFICAGGEVGQDTCSGDGGSPLVCPIKSSNQNQYYQAGVVAWGIGCGDHKIPAVYANVAKFRNWIDDVFIEKGLSTSSYTA